MTWPSTLAGSSHIMCRVGGQVKHNYNVSALLYIDDGAVFPLDFDVDVDRFGAQLFHNTSYVERQGLSSVALTTSSFLLSCLQREFERQSFIPPLRLSSDNLLGDSVPYSVVSLQPRMFVLCWPSEVNCYILIPQGSSMNEWLCVDGDRLVRSQWGRGGITSWLCTNSISWCSFHRVLDGIQHHNSTNSRKSSDWTLYVCVRERDRVTETDIVYVQYIQNVDFIK